jgi:hypothetical protein
VDISGGRVMKKIVSVICMVASVYIGGFAHRASETEKGTRSEQVQLREHVTGTITRIDGKRIRVVEDVDPSGCATTGVKLVDIVDSTKLFRSGTGITDKDLRPGDRVVIEATARGDVLEASEIDVDESGSAEHKH